MGLYESLRIDESGVGGKYNRWTQIGPSFLIRQESPAKKRMSLCQCECGRIELTNYSNLRAGLTKGCTTCHARKIGKANATHGKSRTREYEIWCGIKKRCLNPKCRNYKRYGGRGITICDRWKSSFENFLADVGLSPSPNHEIDRYPNQNGHYEPGNVRWATPKENSRNTRRNFLVSYGGCEMPLVELSEQLNLPYRALYHRIRRGASVEEAIGKLNTQESA